MTTLGWQKNLSNDAYHANKAYVGSSLLKKIRRSNKAFKVAKDAGPTGQTSGQEMGSCVHSMKLEDIPFESLYTMKGTKTSINFKNQVMGMYNALNDHALANLILTKPGAIVERAGFYVDEETKIALKIKPDLYAPDSGGMLVDLKTTTDIEGFEKEVWKFRYDFSLLMYARGIEAIDGKCPDDIVIVAVENKAPFEVRVFDMRPMLNVGRAEHDYRLALKRLKKARETDSWLDKYQDEITLSYPAWVDFLPLQEE